MTSKPSANTTETLRLLIVDDDKATLGNLCRLLKKKGYSATGADGGGRAISLLAKSNFDIVLTDLVMEEVDGLELLARVKHNSPDTEVILLTGHASVSTAIEAIKKGAYHYIEKPVRPQELCHLVDRAAEKVELRRRVRELEAEAGGNRAEPALVGKSPKMVQMIELIRQLAPTDCNVLVTGESGVGKELVASAIHSLSGRSNARFLAINCGAFTEELLANELFGHEKEAFSGAYSAKAGLLESASGGTILLDEVGDMPLSMQGKLLRVVEERKVIRVGGTRPIPVDIRIVAATNQDLKKAVNAGLFRHDLYYRLNVVSITIPPLRERKDDIALLAHHFLHRAIKRTGKDFTGFSDEAMRALVAYSFPGNVRELENVIERAVAMASSGEIHLRDLPPDLVEMNVFSFERPGSGIRTLREMQRDYIRWVMDRVGRNKSKAAELLGIDRSSLWRHLKDHEIEE